MRWWEGDDGRHEGWDAAVFPDGRVSTGPADGGARVHPIGSDGRIGYGRGDVVDGRTAIGWRGHCACGWQGPLWERVAQTRHDFAARRIYALSECLLSGAAPDDVAVAIRAEWETHLDPPSLVAVRKAAEAVRRAQGHLDAAVRAARKDGRTWTRIGESAGVRRQYAQERWGPDPAGPWDQAADRR